MSDPKSKGRPRGQPLTSVVGLMAQREARLNQALQAQARIIERQNEQIKALRRELALTFSRARNAAAKARAQVLPEAGQKDARGTVA